MKYRSSLLVLTIAAVGIQVVQTGCVCRAGKGVEARCAKPDLLAALPAGCPTPDGMAIDANGDLVVACPNFVDQTQPACLVRIDPKTLTAERWVTVPPLEETGMVCPMGIAFGPDGDLFVCDNQGWKGTPQGQFKGRLLRLRIRDNRAVATVVAEGMEHPNGVRVRDGYVYVTQSLMSKVKCGAASMVSAVYRFRLNDTGVKISNTLEDLNILAVFTTENQFCPYGVDGLVFDSEGNLFVGNFGDGKLHKIEFDASGNVRSNAVFAQTDYDRRLDPQSPGFLERAARSKMRTIDGICTDAEDNIYVADFSNNAVVRVTPSGEIDLIWQNGDTDGRDGGLNQPGEPIVWNGRLVVSNFDAVYGPGNADKINTKNDQPATLSVLDLP